MPQEAGVGQDVPEKRLDLRPMKDDKILLTRTRMSAATAMILLLTMSPLMTLVGMRIEMVSSMMNAALDGIEDDATQNDG